MNRKSSENTTQTIQEANQISKRVDAAGRQPAKRDRTHVNKSWLVVLLLLIGWEKGARIFNQLQA